MSTLIGLRRRVPFSAASQGAPVQTHTFTEDVTTDFLNPERGWYVEDGAGLGATVPNPAPVYTYTHYTTLQMRFVRLDSYRTTATLPSGFLNSLSSEMDSWRTSGKKAVLRCAYDRSGSNGDASWAVMSNHIDQLAPIINSHKDVIAVFQAGFVGHWGEMHGSTNGHTPTSTSGKAFINKLLDVLDTDILVSVRTPQWMVGIFDNDTTLPTFADRFTGSDKSRLAHYNDCFGAGERMVTWWGDAPWSGNWEGERAYAYAAGRYSVAGGESCSAGGGLSSWNDAPYIIGQMQDMGIDYLNSEYWISMYDKWKTSGHLAQISRNLGYRIALTSIEAPTTLSPNQPFTVTLTLHNQGYGKIYNPRPLDLILVPTGGGAAKTIRLSSDIRRDFPLGGQTVSPTFSVTAPGDLGSGTYNVAIALPDRSEHLASDVRYSVRLANVGLWDVGTGRNNLGFTITV